MGEVVVLKPIRRAPEPAAPPPQVSHDMPDFPQEGGSWHEPPPDLPDDLPQEVWVWPTAWQWFCNMFNRA